MLLVAVLRLLRVSALQATALLAIAIAAALVGAVLARRAAARSRSASSTSSSSSSASSRLNVFAGVPIAFSFALATFGYLALTTATPMLVMVGRLDEGMSHLILLAVPLFIFLGALIEMTGMARAMIQFLASLLGHVRGGLSYVLIGAMYLVSGISGSKVADMAAIAPVLFPEMKKRGAKPGDLVALLSATGAQTETIPPSHRADHHRLGDRRLDRRAVHRRPAAGRGAGRGAVRRRLVALPQRGPERACSATASARSASSLLIALPALALPFVIRAAVVEGVATATEVSTIGIVYAVLVGLLVYRQFDWRASMPMLVETASLSGAIIFIVGCATAHGLGADAVGLLAGPGRRRWRRCRAAPTASWRSRSSPSSILGSVLEGIPAIVLFGPLLFPIAKQAGVHEVHYAMVVIFAMGIGLFAPPFGVGYYGACAISKVNPDEGLKHIWGYMLALLDRPGRRRGRPVDLDRLPQILNTRRRGQCIHEPILRRDPPGRLCRARHRGGDGLLEPRARRRPVVLQPSACRSGTIATAASATSRTIRWRSPIPGRCRSS